MVEEIRRFFKEKGFHPLVAWARFFDGVHGRRVTVEQFAESMGSLAYDGSAEDLFHRIDREGKGFLTLMEIDRCSADLWNSFKAWSCQTFSEAAEMAAKLGRTNDETDEGSNLKRSSTDIAHSRLSLVSARHMAITSPGAGGRRKTSELIGISERDDAEPSEKENAAPLIRRGSRRSMTLSSALKCGFNKNQFMDNSVQLGWYNSSETILFKALDLKGCGYVIAEDIVWFEKEKEVQAKKLISKTKTNKGNLTLMRQRVQATRSLQAFLAFLRRQYGCVFKAWRILFDKDGTMSVTRKTFLAACRSVGWAGDHASLWRALEIDESGTALCEDLAPSQTRALSKFKVWMVNSFGDSKTMMRALNTANGTRTKLSKSGRLTKDLWTEACMKKRCPVDFHDIFDLVDYEGHGSVMVKNFRFLDTWQVCTPWLLEDPCPEAVKQLKSLLVYRYKTHVKAWVKLIDRSYSGKATWADFKAALQQINFKGNFAAAWLALDEDNSGHITLQEFDETAADTLATFRCWCDSEFGGVVLAFRAMDADESQTLSYKEFRKGVKEHGYRGHDVQRLFHSLDIESKGQLRPEDLFFLDEWELTEILDVHLIDDVTDSDNDKDSDDDDSDSDSSENDGQVTLDETKMKAKGPQHSRRSALPWPRIDPGETPPNPSGKRSKLLPGCLPTGLLHRARAKKLPKQARPLHIQILEALRSSRDGGSSSRATTMMSVTPRPGSTTGLPETGHGSPDLRAILTADSSQCVSPAWPDRQTWTSDSSRCSSPVRLHELLPPRSRSALGSSRDSPIRNAPWDFSL